jgi:hypothetical protein
MAVGHLEEFREKFARSIEPAARGDGQRLDSEVELALSFVGRLR